MDVAFNKKQHSVTKRSGKVVTNTLYSEEALEKDNSMLTGPRDLLKLFEEGSFNFVTNWADLFKIEFEFHQTKIDNPKVLDLGSRTGMFRAAACRNLKHIDYTGIEMDKGLINREYKVFTTEDTTFYHMNLSGKTLPFDDNTFDIVLANDIIEHLNTPEDGLKLLREAIRVGKDVIYVVTPNNRFPNKEQLLYPATHTYEFSMKEVEDTISECGGKVVEKYGILALKKEIDKKLEERPDVKEMFDKTMVKSGHLRNTIIAQMFPEISKDVMYVVKK